MPLKRGGSTGLLVGLILTAGAATAEPASVFSGPSAADGTVTQEMSPAAARALARQALDIGRPDIAARIARQILAVLPDDPEALLLLAAAETGLGQGAAGAAAGRRAYAVSHDKAQRFEAAFLAAYGHSLADETGRAKLWLRRASDLAPDPASAAMVAKSYRDLAGRTPLRFRATLDAGRRDNVNGGSRHATMEIFGLPFSIPEALPGGVWTLGIETTYTLQKDQAGITELFAAVTHQGVWLSEEAAAIAPDARAADFAFSQVEAGLSRRWLHPTAPLAFGVSASALANWYGGEALSTGLRLRGTIDWTGRTNEVWSAGLRLEQSDNAVRSVRDATIAEMSFGWRTAGAEGGNFGLLTGLRRTDSAAADVENDAAFLTLTYAPEQTPGGIATSFSLGAEARDFPQQPGVSADRKLSAEASFTFTEVDYLGFVPRLTVSAERNRSDFRPRDTSDVSVGIGIVSRF